MLTQLLQFVHESVSFCTIFLLQSVLTPLISHNFLLQQRYPKNSNSGVERLVSNDNTREIISVTKQSTNIIKFNLNRSRDVHASNSVSVLVGRGGGTPSKTRSPTQPPHSSNPIGRHPAPSGGHTPTHAPTSNH